MQLDLLPKPMPSAAGAPDSLPTETVDTPPSADSPVQDEKSPDAFKTISEAATLLDVPQHVLRFWESRFPQIKPLKMRGGRRYYRPEDMRVLMTIKHLLYKEGYTIKGAKKVFNAKKNEVFSSSEPPPVSAAAKPQPSTAKETSSPQNDRHSTLEALRQELIDLRDSLEPYVFT